MINRIIAILPGSKLFNLKLTYFSGAYCGPTSRKIYCAAVYI